MSRPGLLRALLRECEEAAPGEGLPAIASRLGISPAEAADLADYWVRKGRLKREEIGAPECDGCFFASAACKSACPSAPGRGRPSAPVLIALSPVRGPARDPARDRRPSRPQD